MLSQLNARRGFTLMEMMIALVIGMIIMIAVGSMFISSRKNTSAQIAFARIQENGRFAIEWLTSFSRNAGVRASILSSPAAVFPSATPFPSIAFTPGAVLRGVEGSRDEFTVREEGSTARPIMDCNGTLAPAAGAASPLVVSLRFYVSGSKLLCDSTNSGNAQVVADNVIDMQLVYGQDTKTGLSYDGYPTRYVNASNVTSGSTWDKVVSMRICLTVVSVDNNVAVTPQTYETCSSAVAQNPATIVAADRRLYKNFQTLVNLRNAGAN